MKLAHCRLILLLTLAPLVARSADKTPTSADRTNRPGIDRIWLGHRSHDPGKLAVNWMTKEPGDSIVRFGRTANCGQEVRVANHTTIHHVEIPLEESGGVYHYSVRTAISRRKTSPSRHIRAASRQAVIYQGANRNHCAS